MAERRSEWEHQMITAITRNNNGIILRAGTLNEMKKCRTAGGIQIAVYSNYQHHLLSADFFFDDEIIVFRLLGQTERSFSSTDEPALTYSII